MKRTIKITLLALAMVFMTQATYAQAKFGYINSLELLTKMPDVKAADKRIADFYAGKEVKLKQYQSEFDAKYVEVQKMADELSEASLEAELKVLASLQNRIDQYRSSASDELATKRQTEYAPIVEKATKAVQDVAKENGYTYIFDNANATIIYAPEGDNILNLVMTKLGI